MIEYSDYSGQQGDVIVRDGELAPFDRAAAEEMARHAHRLATGSEQPATDSADADAADAPLDRSGLTAA